MINGILLLLFSNQSTCVLFFVGSWCCPEGYAT